jgi:hypothetical protein
MKLIARRLGKGSDMKKLILGLAFLLAGAANAFAQSTTVSGNVTDASSQAWAGGTLQFQFVPNPQFPTGPYTWTGGALNNVIPGVLDGSGNYSVSVPSSTAISPQGSKWILQVTPNATSPSFSTAAATITGGSQTLNATPPAVTISPSPVNRAYADGEVTGAVIGSEYFNTTTLLVRVCTALTSGACTTWANVGAGAGGGCTPSGVAGTVQASNGSGGCQVTSIVDTGTFVEFPTEGIEVGVNLGLGSLANNLTGATIYTVYTTGATVTAGQLVKFSASGFVVPTATTDTTGIIGEAFTSAAAIASVAVIRIGTAPVPTTDNAGSCTAGILVINSTTAAGQGHCTASPGTAQVVGAITGGAVSFDVYPLESIASGGGSFSALTGGTNTTAAMLVGTGASLTVSGSGTINATTLGGATFAAPGPIGSGTASTGAFSTISATGQITSTLAIGTAPFVVTSTTNVANLNASSLSGATFAAPGAIGGTTPAAGTFTTLTARTSLTAGVSGTTQGCLTLAGATSGSGTICAPALAGTNTNPFAISNVLAVPAATTSSNVGYGFAGFAGSGMFLDSSNDVVFSINGNTVFGLQSGTINIQVPSTFVFDWSSGGFTGGSDLGISRSAAGVGAIGKGGGGTTTGTLLASAYGSAGTKFTASGCSNSATLGGATAGQFTSGTTGTCTVTITMGDGDTATTGWACWASDQTTSANLFDQATGGSTTTAVLKGTTVSGDIISFGCMRY